MTITEIRAHLRPHLVPLFLLVAATVVVYARILGHDFLITWDDDQYVTDNPAIRGVTLEHLKMAFSRYYVGNWAPVQIVSYMLDYSLWGLRAGGFLLTNILLHMGNGALYYFLVVRIAGRRFWAFVAAFVFLLHPVQVESVAWVSQRKNLLAMLFFLASFHCYLVYRERREGEGRFPYAASLGGFVLALMAKSVVVITPVVLCLYDICYPPPRRKRWVLDKLPYVALTCVIALLTLYSQRPELGGGRASYYGGSPLATFLTMIPVVKRYVLLLLWPGDLKVFYEPAIKRGIDGEVAAAALLLGLVICGGVLLYRRNRRLFFWWGLFFIGLVPVLQIVPLTTLMNDRYLYFPMLGGAALFAGAMDSLLELSPAKWRRWGVAAVCLLLAPLPVLARQRTDVWKNPVTLVQDYLRGKSDAEQREARSLVLEKIVAKMEAGKSRKARELLHVFVGAWPDYAPGFAVLGNSYYMSGDIPEAKRYLTRALELDPRSVPVLLALGNISLAHRDLVEAGELYRRALASGGADREVEYGLACLESLAGHRQEAMDHLGRAMQLGFRDMERIRNNRELDPLRALPGFQQLIERYTRKE